MLRVLLQVPLELARRCRCASVTGRDRVHAQLAVDALPQRARLEVEHRARRAAAAAWRRALSRTAPGIEVELVGDAVAHEHAALAVEDLAARRAHDDLLLVVARRLRDERARVEHLQRPQPQHEQHEEHDHGDAERAEPQLQAPVRARREAGVRRWLRHPSPASGSGSGNWRRGGALTPSAKRSSASSGIAKQHAGAPARRRAARRTRARARRRCRAGRRCRPRRCARAPSRPRPAAGCAPARAAAASRPRRPRQ